MQNVLTSIGSHAIWMTLHQTSSRSKTMPNTPVRAAAEGMPKEITRRDMMRRMATLSAIGAAGLPSALAAAPTEAIAPAALPEVEIPTVERIKLLMEEIQRLSNELWPDICQWNVNLTDPASAKPWQRSLPIMLIAHRDERRES
jgi:hypothetical protein